MTVDEVVELFDPARFRWWLSGGHALDAHLQRSWRPHADIDVGIERADATALRHVLDGWEIHLASNGILTPWDGQRLDDRSDSEANNLWCRPSPAAAWKLDILVGDGNEHEWIYRRDPAVRRPWAESVLTTARGTPYLAPELQLLFKSKGLRPKDNSDAAVVIPELEPERRAWLAGHLPADHPWQSTIAGERASRAIRGLSGSEHRVGLLASGRSSQAWGTVDGDRQWVIRVPIPNSGRLISYRSEVLIGDLLADAEHPVSRWQPQFVDNVECSIGTLLDGTPIDYDAEWTSSFAESMAALLRDLHRLPTTGWGPLENRDDLLRGSSASATSGIIDRWFHASMWPFDGTELSAHDVARTEPGLAATIGPRHDDIAAAASEPFGIVHSDLHNEHLLHVGGRLTGLLDFGDAFIGSTAWDFALIHWYYGVDNVNRVAAAYGADADLTERAALLAIAVGCYKVAKSPDDPAVLARLRSLLTQ